ncbi:MAG TPA: alpha-L-fucosidase [Roseiflexaceae bacterium]|nr:alpha-L-fucosidase [Roseiflexaceae bacterium]
MTHLFEPTWESLRGYRVPAWFEDAKFGIFIHWGVYAVPAFANEWYSRNMYQPDSPEFLHHRATYGPQTEFGYKDFIPGLTGARFDPDAWVGLCLEAGARYLIPVAEHHDGFAMYASGLTEWNAGRVGPRRDVLGELAGAARRRGLIFGLSNHRAENWWFFNGGRLFPSDVQDPRYTGLYGPAMPENTPPDDAFLHAWRDRLYEQVERYRPEIVYFDTGLKESAFAPLLRQFAADFYNRGEAGRGAVITYKHDAFPEGAAVLDVERGRLGATRALAWQTDTAIARNSWCHVAAPDYKSAGELVRDLADVVSKNGSLLLNIGPRADGSIPEAEQAILREIGAWLAHSGAAIYGTRPWRVSGEGPTQAAAGAFTDGAPPAFTGADIRFTSRPGAIYAICLGRPAPNLTIRALADDTHERIAAVRLLDGDIPLDWWRHAGGLTIQLPPALPEAHAYAIKIVLAEVG